MSYRNDGFDFEVCHSRHEAIDYGRARDGAEFTAYSNHLVPKARQMPSYHYMLHVFRNGEPVLDVLLRHPMLSRPVGKRAIKKWLKGKRDPYSHEPR